MTKWFQVNDKIFIYKYLNTQTTIGSHGTTYISMNMSQNPDAYEYFTKLYDSRFGIGSINLLKKDIIFSLKTNNMELFGCVIKHMDFDFNSRILNLDIISDYMVMVDVENRRDERIDQILNKTSE